MFSMHSLILSGPILQWQRSTMSGQFTILIPTATVTNFCKQAKIAIPTPNPKRTVPFTWIAGAPRKPSPPMVKASGDVEFPAESLSVSGRWDAGSRHRPKNRTGLWVSIVVINCIRAQIFIHSDCVGLARHGYSNRKGLRKRSKSQQSAGRVIFTT